MVIRKKQWRCWGATTVRIKEVSLGCRLNETEFKDVEVAHSQEGKADPRWRAWQKGEEGGIKKRILEGRK